MKWLVVAMVWVQMGCAGGFYEQARAEQAAEEAVERAEADRPDLDQLTARGRFDLQCPDAAAVILERHDTGPLTLVGVQGCGKQAQYSRRLRRDVAWGGMTTRNTHWDRVDHTIVIATTRD